MPKEHLAQERNLLFGVLAVQLKLVTPRQLVDAGAIWAANQDRRLGEILVEQGMLGQKQQSAIQGLLDVQLDAHDGNAAAALQAFGGSAAVNESFDASIVYDTARGVEYRSIGGDTPRPVQENEKSSLSDAEQLTTEHPGRYTIQGEQGRGGTGRVVIAVDEHIGREIALKELLPDSAIRKAPIVESPVRQSATLTARFLREARITGQLEHPGIVPVYEVGKRADGTNYYTMKLVRGKTLAKKLKHCKGIGDRLTLLPHYLDLCQAIAYAHSRGVIHRDIKPANVMIGEFGEAVLIDWGLAKVKGQKDEGAQKLAEEIKLLKEAGASETVAGKPIGTPSYMPPEQADGHIEAIDERSDVWSLGALLYEILTGQPPFTGSTALEVIGKVLSDDVAPVLEIQQDAPGELAAVAEKCLQRNHVDRYQSVLRLANDIAAFQSGGLVDAYTYSTALVLARWAKRHRAYLIGLVVVLLAICIGIGYAWHAISVERDNAVYQQALADQQRGIAEQTSDDLRQANLHFLELCDMSDELNQKIAQFISGDMEDADKSLAEVFSLLSEMDGRQTTVADLINDGSSNSSKKHVSRVILGRYSSPAERDAALQELSSRLGLEGEPVDSAGVFRIRLFEFNQYSSALIMQALLYFAGYPETAVSDVPLGFIKE